MLNIKMEAIPEPESGKAAVLVLTKFNMARTNPYVIMSGQGSTNYVCGACNAVLAEKVDRGQISHIVFKCGNCETFNALRGN